MTDLMRRATNLGALAALPVAVGAGDLTAQENAAVAEANCVAWLTPETIPAEDPAVPVEVRLAQEIGTITAVEAAGSGLSLTEPDPEGEQPWAADGEGDLEPPPRSRNTHVVWFDARGAEPGDYRITLEGDAGRCTAHVSVVGAPQGSRARAGLP